MDAVLCLIIHCPSPCTHNQEDDEADEGNAARYKQGDF